MMKSENPEFDVNFNQKKICNVPFDTLMCPIQITNIQQTYINDPPCNKWSLYLLTPPSLKIT